MDIKRTIANNIYILRNYYNLTQAEFAQKLTIPVTRGHISRIETGNHVPSAEFIKSVSESFNVSADWLLSNNIKFYNIPDSITLTNTDLEIINTLKDIDENIKLNILSLIKSIKRV